MANADLKQLKVRMTQTSHSKLKRMAKKQKTSMASIVNGAVQKELKLQKA